MKMIDRFVGMLLCVLLLAMPAQAEEARRLIDIAVMDGQLLALDGYGILAEQDGAWREVCSVPGGQFMAVSGETLYVLCRDGVARYAWRDDELARQDVLIGPDALPDSFFYDMAAEGDEVYLLGLPNTDVPYNRRSIYKFEDGAIRQLCEGDYTNLAIAEGWLLTIARHEDKTILAAINRDTGRENNFAVLDEPLDQGMISGLAADGGYAYAMGQARLYRMHLDSGKVETAAYVPRDDARSVGSVAAVIQGDAYRFLHSEQGLMAAGTDPAALEGRPLQVSEYQMGWSDEVINAFAEIHPETPVAVKRPLYGNEMSAIVQAVINQDGGLDIFEIYMQSTGYLAMRDKGYCAPLNGSEALTAYVDGMYPVFTDLLWHEGNLCAVPVSLKVGAVSYHEELLEEAGMTEDDLPRSIMELMDFIAEWDTDQPVPLFNSPEKMLRRQLFYLIRDTQEAWCAAQGIDMTWDTPEALALLQKLDEITPALNRFSTIGNPDTLLSMVEDYQPTWRNSDYQPLPLPRVDGEDYYLKAYVGLLAVNPYSPMRAEAIELLECAVRYGFSSDMVWRAMSPDENDPIEEPSYRLEMDQIASERARLNKLLEDETISDTERESAEQLLELCDIRAAEAERIRWRFTKEDIARWRELAEHMYVLPTPSGDVLLNVRDRYLDGQLTAEQFVREAENVMWMIRMEQE